MASNLRSTPIIGLITAESLSLLGNQIGAVTIPILVLQFTNSPMVTGIASAGNIVPIILAAILGGLATHQYEVIFSAGLAGLLLGAGNPLQQTILHEETPEIISGKVFTSLSAIHFIAGPFGLLLAGLMIEFSNVERVLLLAGGLLLASAIFGWYRLPLVTQTEISLHG